MCSIYNQAKPKPKHQNANACATSQNAQQVRTTRVRGVSTPPQIKTLLTITRSFRTSNFTPLDVGSYCERYNKGPTRNCPCLRALVSSRNVLLSVSLYICVTGSPRRPARLAARQEDTLYHNVSLTRDSEVARAPRSASPPFGNQRPNACMRMLVDLQSLQSPPQRDHLCLSPTQSCTQFRLRVSVSGGP